MANTEKDHAISESSEAGPRGSLRGKIGMLFLAGAIALSSRNGLELDKTTQDSLHKDLERAQAGEVIASDLVRSVYVQYGELGLRTLLRVSTIEQRLVLARGLDAKVAQALGEALSLFINNPNLEVRNAARVAVGPSARYLIKPEV